MGKTTCRERERERSFTKKKTHLAAGLMLLFCYSVFFFRFPFTRFGLVLFFLDDKNKKKYELTALENFHYDCQLERTCKVCISGKTPDLIRLCHSHFFVRLDTDMLCRWGANLYFKKGYEASSE